MSDDPSVDSFDERDPFDDNATRRVTCIRHPCKTDVVVDHLHRIKLRRTSGVVIDTMVYNARSVEHMYTHDVHGDLVIEYKCLYVEPEEVVSDEPLPCWHGNGCTGTGWECRPIEENLRGAPRSGRGPSRQHLQPRSRGTARPVEETFMVRRGQAVDIQGDTYNLEQVGWHSHYGHVWADPKAAEPAIFDDERVYRLVPVEPLPEEKP